EPGLVRLVVTDTGADIARLTGPEQTRLQPCCFTPDGTKLITLGRDAMALYIFDLRAIRAGLAELDLDWDAPPLPAATTGDLPPPLAIHFNLGGLGVRLPQAQASLEQAASRIAAREYAKALADYTRAVDLDPNNATAWNSLAWLLATCPDAKFRDPA